MRKDLALRLQFEPLHQRTQRWELDLCFHFFCDAAVRLRDCHLMHAHTSPELKLWTMKKTDPATTGVDRRQTKGKVSWVWQHTAREFSISPYTRIKVSRSQACSHSALKAASCCCCYCCCCCCSCCCCAVLCCALLCCAVLLLLLLLLCFAVDAAVL